MDDLKKEKVPGLTAVGVKCWGLVFLAAGIVSKSVLQNGILGMESISPQQLLEAMQASRSMMMAASLALVLQAASTCAIPIFAFMLIEGAVHTSDFTRYILRIFGLAILSELPYNLAMSGKLIDTATRNPVFAMAVGLLMLYFYRRFEADGAANTLVKFTVTLAAAGWCFMLRIDTGIYLILVLGILWLFRQKAVYRGLAGASAAALCSISSPFFLASPMGMLVVHFYNERKGTTNRWCQYLAYPAVLLAAALATALIR